LLERQIPRSAVYAPMSEAEFVNLVNDFFFHAVWTQKKLRRGETWTAMMCLDGYLKRHLRRALEMGRCGERDVWHDGRFLDRWAGEETGEALRACFARYDAEDMAAALLATVRLFARVGHEAAQKHGYAWPDGAEQYARSLLGA
ncbi:MAG: aminoglycoside 6-adenylyltransferase, partial [Clostridia bacterium]|nr:aminoglycoside 6-adenylyltransferase [Clostridia bacterium]